MNGKPPFYLTETVEVHLFRNAFVFRGLRIHFPGSFRQHINSITFHGDVNQHK